MTLLALIASVFLPVYSPTSASPLHVAGVDTNTMAVVKSWEFPSSYTGHRSVCRLPGADTNMVFHAWTGGATYNPGTDPFGTSRGYEYPVVEVTAESPITPRFDLWKTPLMLVATTNTVATTNMPPTEPTRVRVVRWKIDDMPTYSMAVTNRVVFDKVLDPRVATMLTEADFLGEGIHDLDWDNFYDEVVNGRGVVGRYKVEKADYLVFFGDGEVGWTSSFETNKWLEASARVITRRFNDCKGFVATALTYEPATNGSFGAISWTVSYLRDGNDYPLASTNVPPVAMSVIYKDDWPSASMRQEFLAGHSDSNLTFNVYGTFRMPPQSGDGRWRWWPPSSFSAPGRVFGIYIGDAKCPPRIRYDGDRFTNSTVTVISISEIGFGLNAFCEIPE